MENIDSLPRARDHQTGDFPELVSVSKLVGKALYDFAMVQEGDKIAVAVSGGKDSISLLHVLRHRQKIIPINFTFTAVHIDFEFADFDPAKLIQYFKDYHFPFIVEKVGGLKNENYQDIDCFRWSRHRRKALFQLADRMGFTKIAFGHHLDDIVETIVINQFYRGEIGAMKPKQELFDGKVTIIRPLAYVREEQMRALAQSLKIETIGGQSKCANDDTSHRMIVKQMLQNAEQYNPAVVKNIFNSLQNIKEEYLIVPERNAKKM
ncbi:MAG: tRNA 2-thiocytidine(32) synthetase TtcA [Candidatus Omnitrophica bacterium]|nr:tRNA 2-thiocytidine(32) synthetase TtcA [Candidatus Omnitrophota bacterium]